jgi:hypothetical protein
LNWWLTKVNPRKLVTQLTVRLNGQANRLDVTWGLGRDRDVCQWYGREEVRQGWGSIWGHVIYVGEHIMTCQLGRGMCGDMLNG